MASATRDHFSSRLGVLAATLGSAVGLGNIWKFPSLVGQNGGASFLVVYLLASLCIGLPLMISDLSLGRAGRSNVISIFQKIHHFRFFYGDKIFTSPYAFNLISVFKDIVQHIFLFQHASIPYMVALIKLLANRTCAG